MDSPIDARNRSNLRIGGVMTPPCNTHSQGSADEIGKSWRQKILAQPKVLKMEEYCMYFPFSELHGWDKRFAAQPQTI